MNVITVKWHAINEKCVHKLTAFFPPMKRMLVVSPSLLNSPTVVPKIYKGSTIYFINTAFLNCSLFSSFHSPISQVTRGLWMLHLGGLDY